MMVFCIRSEENAVVKVFCIGSESAVVKDFCIRSENRVKW